MNRLFFVLSFALVLLATGSTTASAHETRTYRIDGATYAITVGSIGEPLVVDDKSGTDVTIMRNGVPYVGAETALEVEVMSGSATKVFPLEAVYNAPGKYKTVFFPTTADALSYRLFGTVGDQPFDVTFSCSTGGHAMHGEEDTTEVVVSEGVTQIAQRGAFTCPSAKSEFEFPATTRDQKGMTDQLGVIAMTAVTALLLAILALIIAIAQSPRLPRLKRSVDSLFEAPVIGIVALIVIVLFVSSFVTAALMGTSHHGGHADHDEHKGHAMKEGTDGISGMEHGQHAPAQ